MSTATTTMMMRSTLESLTRARVCILLHGNKSRVEKGAKRRMFLSFLIYIYTLSVRFFDWG